MFQTKPIELFLSKDRRDNAQSRVIDSVIPSIYMRELHLVFSFGRLIVKNKKGET